MQSNLRRRMLIVKIVILLIFAPLLAWGAYYVHSTGDQIPIGSRTWDAPTFLIALVPLLVYAFIELMVTAVMTRWEIRRLAEFAKTIEQGASGTEFPDFPELQPIVDAFEFKQRQLQKESNKINWILRHIPGGLITINAKAEIIFFVCPAFEEMGIDVSGLVGQHVSKYQERISYNSENSPIMEALHKGVKSRRISKVADRYFEAVNTPTITDAGIIDGAVCLFVDVTERVKQEIEMKRMEKLRLVGQMAASLSHEIRNPLTVIRGFLQLYANQVAHEDVQSQFQMLIGEIDRVTQIVQEFLALTRDRVGSLREECLTKIVGQLAPLLASEASINGVSLQLDLLDTPPIPLSDNDIKQLLLNLYRNAVEACQTGGIVEISTGVDPVGQPFLRVQDNGCGMPSQVLEKIGTPFISTKENGTGLGIPLCLSVAEAHGAELSFDQAPTQGTIVTVRFPKAKLSAPAAVAR